MEAGDKGDLGSPRIVAPIKKKKNNESNNLLIPKFAKRGAQ